MRTQRPKTQGRVRLWLAALTGILALLWVAAAHADDIDLGFLDGTVRQEEEPPPPAEQPAQQEQPAQEETPEPEAPETEPAEDAGELQIEIPGLQTAQTEEEAAAAENAGTLAGRVLDSETGEPLSGVTILVGEEGEYVGVTDVAGQYSISGIPAGTYDVSFSKAGYRNARMTNKAIEAGTTADGTFPLPPAPVETADQIFELEEFVIEATEVSQQLIQLQDRLGSDRLVNLFGAEEFARFGAGDVAEALQRVAGVSVVEGQFAVIRGLSDRYSSTTFMGAPVPSPDPTRQSVQLDLFPSDIVSNLEISKSFAPELPSNSAGGNVDIVANNYPEEFTAKIKAGTGFNDRAINSYLPPQDGSALPGNLTEGSAPTETDFGASIGITQEWKGRDLRFYYGYSREEDFSTDEGFTESQQPSIPRAVGGFPDIATKTYKVTPGSLAFGEVPLSKGRYGFNSSDTQRRATHFLGVGFDWDKDANHTINFSLFNNVVDEKTLNFDYNGFIPGADYSSFNALRDDLGVTQDLVVQDTLIQAAIQSDGVATDEADAVGHSTSDFFQSSSFFRTRELTIYQGNGSHRFEGWADVEMDWIFNHSETSQKEEARKFSYWYTPEIDGVNRADEEQYRLRIGNQGVGQDEAIFLNSNDISEASDYQSIHIEASRELREGLSFTFRSGLSVEDADRDVVSNLANLSGTHDAVTGSPYPLEDTILNSLGVDDANNYFTNTNKSGRTIHAHYFDGKLSILDKVELLFGMRFEDLILTTKNDPFEETLGDQSGEIFPSRYLMFDTRDGSTASEGYPGDGDVGQEPDTTNLLPGNPAILGLNLPSYMIDPDGTINPTQDDLRRVLNSDLEEELFLPRVGFTVRPMEGLSIRGVYSESLARPSFRERAYYISTDPDTEELVIGNPLLETSKAINRDIRIEYTYGERGDLFAFSFFTKDIDNPIEQIRIRDGFPPYTEYQTFFNNRTSAGVEGIEIEFRKNLEFMALEHFTIGGNYTLIDASVNRSDAQVQAFERTLLGGTREILGQQFSPVPEDPDAILVTSVPTERRLFEQPEWIANADITFEHPDWGTTATLAVFTISDVLKSVGSVAVDQNGSLQSVSLDEYSDSFYQVDFVLRQKWRGWTFGFSVKNLTDSTRATFYDEDMTIGKVYKKKYKVGRDYSISASYSF